MSGKYTIGKTPPTWSDSAQSITFIVTEDCNLRCKYCYITHKTSNKRMKFETAKKFIDYILTADIERADDVIIDFIGGEPMIEMKLVDQISDYFKKRAYELNIPWAWRYRLNFSTNGVNYNSPEVQAYIKKNKGKISIGMSIDGTKEKHDLNRVFPDNSGSYEIIEKNIPLWISQFSPSTKMTFASADLKFLKESVIDLWKHGVTEVLANVVFEDVWQDGDDLLFEQQLKDLADYILENELFDKCYCTFFSETIGGYMSEDARDIAYCGAGKMIALGPDGKLYPCMRYKDYSLNHHEERLVGTIDTGINMDLVRAFMASSTRFQDDEECFRCPVASGCAQCQGFNYDEADTSTNFQRAKYICKMHKAQARANEYYFAKLYNRFGIDREYIRDIPRMYFLLSDNYVSFCSYNNDSGGANDGCTMTLEQIKVGLEYCRQNFFSPTFVHGDSHFLKTDFSELFDDYYIQHILPVQLSREAVFIKDALYVFTHETIGINSKHLEDCIYNIQQIELDYLANDVITLFENVDRINVNILDLDANFDESRYLDQLRTIKDYLVSAYQHGHTHKEINLITDLCYSNVRSNCGAGDKSFVYAPNGPHFITQVNMIGQ